MPRRRTLVAALCGTTLALTAAGTFAGLTSASASEQRRAIDPASPLSLYSPTRMEISSYDGYVYSDFGLRYVAGDQPFEIHAHRPSYDQPIAATWIDHGDLPAGSMTSFQGLDNFLTIKIFNVKTGKRVYRFDQAGCFNGYETQRIDPDGPARSPFPESCPWNPYTVGSVMGIQAQWSSPAILDYGIQAPLKPGKYDVTATIDPDWATYFQIPAEAATTTTRAVVVKERECCYGRSAAGTPSKSAPLKPARTSAPARASVAFEGPMPDLRTLPAFGIGLNRNGNQLRFGANVWNAGPSPMVVDGYRSSTDQDDMDAYQYFYDADGNELGHEQVGHMHWHADNHNHWHFEDFATYELLNEDKTLAVRSGKQSFCLAPTDPIDLTVTNAARKQRVEDLGSACRGYEALSVREALPVGWGDTYYQYRAGQSFGIKGLADGIYWIRVQANPAGALLEESYDNNSYDRKIKLTTNNAGVRRVKVFQEGIVDEFYWGGGYRR